MWVTNSMIEWVFNIIKKPLNSAPSSNIHIHVLVSDLDEETELAALLITSFTCQFISLHFLHHLQPEDWNFDCTQGLVKT